MARLRRTLTAVTAAAPVLAATAAPALAATSSDGGATAATPQSVPCCGGSGHYVTWQNQNNGDYLHVKGASTGQSAEINIYTGSGTCEYYGQTDLQCAEEWDQISTGYSHEFMYDNVNSGMCLDDGEHALGIHPTQYPCDAANENERWIYGTLDNGSGVPFYDALYVAGGQVMCNPAGGGGSLYIYAANELLYSNTGHGHCSWH